MRRSEIRACDRCGGQLNGGQAVPLPVAGYKVTTQRLIIDQTALRQTAGMETFFGGGGDGAALASVMTGDPEILQEPPELRDQLLICEPCAVPILLLLEEINARKETDPS